MYQKISAVLAVAAVGGIAALLAGGATASGSAVKHQRIAIVLGSNVSTFKLTPLTTGPVHRDSGSVDACCFARQNVTRDGQSAEINDPTLTFSSKRGTFSWHSHITFVDIDHNYTVATAVWTITHGTGAYAHLEGHGRQAFVQKTAQNQDVADKAEGIVTER